MDEMYIGTPEEQEHFQFMGNLSATMAESGDMNEESRCPMWNPNNNSCEKIDCDNSNQIIEELNGQLQEASRTINILQQIIIKMNYEKYMGQ